MGVRRLRALIEEATVDAYGESEQETGFLTMIEANVKMPFPARMVGEDVKVRGFDVDDKGQGIVAVVHRRGRNYRVKLLELECGAVLPPGFEWIEAYELWAKGAAELFPSS